MMDIQTERSRIVSAGPGRILIVDDSVQIRLTLGHQLQSQGYTVSLADGGRDALRVIDEEGFPDLVVLDIMMPEMDGFEVAQKLLKYGHMPIICLSALSDTDTKVKALTQFAEDYLTKPYDYRELAARIGRILKRGALEKVLPSEVEIDQRLRLNFDLQRAVIEGEHVPLTPIEARILRILYDNRGHAIAPSYLLSQAWEPSQPGTVTSLRVHIRRLRAKVEIDKGNPRYIITIRGLGYGLSWWQSHHAVTEDPASYMWVFGDPIRPLQHYL